MEGAVDGPPNNNNNGDAAPPQAGPAYNGERVQLNFQFRRDGMPAVPSDGAGGGGPSSGPSNEQAMRAAQSALNHPAVLSALARHAQQSNNGNFEVHLGNPNINVNTDTNTNADNGASAGADSSPAPAAGTSPLNSTLGAGGMQFTVRQTATRPYGTTGTGNNPSPNNTTATPNTNSRNNHTSHNRGRFHFHHPGNRNMNMSHNSPMHHLPPFLQPGNNMSPNIHINLPPLEAQPVPMNTSVNNYNTKQSNPLFDCSICFDILDDPANCSHCNNRFCFSCLTRVLATSASSPSNNNNNNTASTRCPTCRNNFTAADIVRDTHFQQYMKQQPKVICTIPGCNQLLALTEVKKHEATCPMIQMKCKYATMGCQWKGPLKDLKQHIDKDCPYGKIGGLVQKFRESQAAHHFMVLQLREQNAAAHRRLQIQHNMLTSLQQHQFQKKSIRRLFHILHLGLASVCEPVQFLRDKDLLWKNMLSEENCNNRAKVHNFYYFLPSVILLSRISFIGFYQVLQISMGNTPGSREEKFKLAEWTISALCVLVGSAFLVFVHSSYEDKNAPSLFWNQKFSITSTYSISIVRDIVAIGLAALHYTSILISGGRRGYISCIFASIVTTLFPAIMNVMIPSATPSNPSSRAKGVVLFGLRYGFVAAWRGVPSTLDSVVFIRLLISTFGIPDQFDLEEAECFMADLPMEFWVAALIGRVAMFSSMDKLFAGQAISRIVIENENDVMTDAFLTVVILLAVNHFVFMVNLIGEKVGRSAAAKVSDIMTRINSTDTNRSAIECYSFTDMKVFYCVCVGLLGAIAFA